MDSRTSHPKPRRPKSSTARSDGARPAGHRRPKAQPAEASLPAGLAARQAAVLILETILDRYEPLDRAQDVQAARLDRLEARDRGFALNLVRVVLRRLLFLGAAVDRLIERPLPPEARRVRHILLVAAAQICELGTPPHAAVSLAVEQCRRDRGVRRFDKLVNAVLRRVAASAELVATTWDRHAGDIPPWLFARWIATFGEVTARRIAAASLVRAPLDLSVKADPERWAAELGATLLPTGSLRLADAGAVQELAGYASGDWWVQDAAAALPVGLLGAISGLAVADLCAAPGGKTAQLAAGGARVTAVDNSASRVSRLIENLTRLNLSAQVDVVTAEIETWAPAGTFDAVLLDAPCTATGTLRRHPDILHLKSAQDIVRLAETQARLLRHAAHHVRPGGMLVYCTCSLETEEGAHQIDRFLVETPAFSRIPVATHEIGGQPEWITPAGDLRTLPFHLSNPEPGLAGIDGFYAARLRRRQD